jgi:hypothetical protein
MSEKASAPQTDAQAGTRSPGEREGREPGSAPVESGAMLFPLLVLAHYRTFMFDARYGRLGGIPARYAPDEQAGRPDGEGARQPTREAREEARHVYERALRKFQASEGTIRSVYWCVYAPSAVALTVKRRGPLRRVLGIRPPREPIVRIHTATDWLTSAFPEITLLQHHCDTLAMKAAEVLRGTAKVITLEWLFAEQKFLLAAAEEQARRSAPVSDGERSPARGGRGARDGGGSNGGAASPPVAVLPATGAIVSPAAPLSEIVRHARSELLEIERYYDRAANKAARIVYLWGMLAGTCLALGLVALLALIVDVSFYNVLLGEAEVRNFFVAIAAGALGAVVSVLMRMRREDGFTLDYEVGRAQSFRLDSFRPFIGATFGLVVYFALESGLLQIAVPDQNAETGGPEASFYFLALLAFLGGFSERLAKVVLGSAERTIAATFESDDATGAGGGPAAPAAEDEMLGRLERLGRLWKEGVLSDDELEAEKRALLGG